MQIANTNGRRRRMRKSSEIHRGRPWHHRATKWHQARKELKMLDFIACPADSPISTFKYLFSNTLKSICSELRQVCTDKGRNHKVGPDLVPRQSLEWPGKVGGCGIALLVALPAAAEGWRSGSSFGTLHAEARPVPAGSSFAGLTVISSFDQPLAQRDGGFHLPAGGEGLVKLRALIEHAESGTAGYDAWHGRARVPPPKPPSRMTLGEIRHWIAATPGQPHAIGRYQIIPSTLDMLIRRTGLPPETVFSAAVQDRMADLLIHDAGYAGFRAGRIPPERFMDNLARIWAGFPLGSGRSAYHGIAGNRATVTRAFFTGHMRQIFPQEWARTETGLRVATGG